ncbi:MAG: tetratricopeptide repeat protein [Holosporales bacterium]|nr:tetratricopeptide repeat protein [Holosporales bacterium]
MPICYKKVAISLGMLLVCSSHIPEVCSASASKKSTTTTAQPKSTEVLEQALSVYEQFLKPGSAAALNQIAAAYYILGEKSESGGEYQKAKDYFGKAAEHFCKAADAGCNEAEYNAGLAYNRLRRYDDSATHYRKCIGRCQSEVDADLLLKAAVNLSILMLDKHIPQDTDEIVRWVGFCKQYNTNAKAAELLQTSVVILTDINSLQKVDDAGNGQSSDDGAVVIKTLSDSGGGTFTR